MAKLRLFNFISLNGFFKGPNEDISWAHEQQADEFAEEKLKHDDILLFGRKTYEVMVSYWPTEEAKKNSPRVAEGMNKAEKIVFSRTLKQVKWENARVINGDIVEEIRKLKQTSDKDMTLMGSGSIAALFADHGLIDEYQLMVHPLVLPAGTPVLAGIKERLKLKLTGTESLNGNVVVSYEPAEASKVLSATG
jgi:dihydrofolate reductase